MRATQASVEVRCGGVCTGERSPQGVGLLCVCQSVLNHGVVFTCVPSCLPLCVGHCILKIICKTNLRPRMIEEDFHVLLPHAWRHRQAGGTSLQMHI